MRNGKYNGGRMQDIRNFNGRIWDENALVVPISTGGCGIVLKLMVGCGLKTVTKTVPKMSLFLEELTSVVKDIKYSLVFNTPNSLWWVRHFPVTDSKV